MIFQFFLGPLDLGYNRLPAVSVYIHCISFIKTTFLRAYEVVQLHNLDYFLPHFFYISFVYLLLKRSILNVSAISDWLNFELIYFNIFTIYQYWNIDIYMISIVKFHVLVIAFLLYWATDPFITKNKKKSFLALYIFWLINQNAMFYILF